MKVLRNVFIIGTLLALLLGTGCSNVSSEKVQIEEKKQVGESSEENGVNSESQGTVEEQKSGNISDKPNSVVKSPISLETAVIERVVDGDTVELKDGRKVRLVGVNTPESTTRIEPYGKIASDYTKNQLIGKTVYLEKDVSETDKYGRLLRVIWLSPPNTISEGEIRAKMYNAALVLGGYAEPSTFPPDVKYADYFRKFAVEARKAEKGLWSIDPVNGTTKGDLDKPVSDSTNKSTITKTSSSTTINQNPAPAQKESSSPGKIKGNINSKGEKIYHVPGGAYYEKTVAEELFNTEAEAQAAGYRRSNR